MVLVLIGTILVSVIATITSHTILNEKYILKTLNKVNYQKEIYNQIMETFKDNTIQSGLEENVLEGVITENEINEDINNFIHYLYEKDTTISIHEQDVKNRLEENINKQIEEKAKNLTSEEEEAIDTYVNTIVKIYKNGIEYSGEKISLVKDMLIKIDKVSDIAMIVSYIFTVVILVIIIVINKKNALKYLSIALLTVGILLIAVKIAEVNSVSINNILILNKAFSNFIIAVIKNIMLSCLISGIISMVLGIVMSIIGGKTIKE